MGRGVAQHRQNAAKREPHDPHDAARQPATEHRILAPMKAADLAALDGRLALLMAATESPAGQ